MASLTSDQVTGGLVGRSLGVSHVPGIDQRVPPIGAEFQSFSRKCDPLDLYSSTHYTVNEYVINCI